MATDEQLDIVDDEDRVIARGPYSRVLREYHIHRAVAIFMLDEQDQALVSQWRDEAPAVGGCWTIALGGVVRAGEGYEAAAKRWLWEQSRLDAAPRLVTSYQKRTADERQNRKVYAVSAAQEPRLAEEYFNQHRFVTLAQINEMNSRLPFTSDTPALLKLLVDHTSRRESSGSR